MGRGEGGYTLIELTVVVLIFSIVMTLISVSFNTIVTSSGQVIKSAETDIGGLIGLELLRSDLELAGFGLPWSVPSTASYQETTKGEMVDGFPGTVASLFNDPPLDVHGPCPPRAYVSGDNAGFNKSDYLVLKGTALGMSGTARSWSYLNYSAGSYLIKSSKSDVELKPGESERVIVLKSTVSSSGVENRELVLASPGSSTFTLVFNNPLSGNFRPQSREDNYLVYGVDDDKKDENGNSSPLSFPYNRADYYIGNPGSGKMSSTCAGGTGVLYKTTINHNTERLTYYPLLDCVVDMQVIFFVDTDGDGKVDYHYPDISALPADEIRSQLKEVRVYILAQQGKKERTYQYPLDQMPIVVGDAGLDKASSTTYGKRWDAKDMAGLDPDWRNYHWKVYTIVVQPKNL